MKIFVFGNPELETDSIPLEILPELKKKFPQHEFITTDPNEEWEIPAQMIVLDTAYGIDEIKIFDDLDAFETAPRVTAHDFDALTNLRYLKKLGKLKKIKIIALPAKIKKEDALTQISKLLNQLTADL